MSKIVNLDSLKSGFTSMHNKIEKTIQEVESDLSSNIETLSAETVRFGDSLESIEHDIGTNVSSRLTTLSGKIEKVEAGMNGFKLWSGTQGEYDAIKDKDANTIYMIIEEE